MDIHEALDHIINCDLCWRTFLDEADLKKHKRKHDARKDDDPIFTHDVEEDNREVIESIFTWIK